MFIFALKFSILFLLFTLTGFARQLILGVLRFSYQKVKSPNTKTWISREYVDFQATFHSQSDVWIFPRLILQLFHQSSRYFPVYLKKILQNFGSIFFGVFTLRRIDGLLKAMKAINMGPKTLFWLLMSRIAF